MTALSDFLQIILSQPDPERWLFVAAALSLLLLALGIFGKGLGVVGTVAGWLWATLIAGLIILTVLSRLKASPALDLKNQRVKSRTCHQF